MSDTVFIQKRGYIAVGTGLAAAGIMALTSSFPGGMPEGFLGIAGALITWTVYIFIGLYVLLSIPVVVTMIRDEPVSEVIISALFIPAGLFISWLAASRIGFPVFKWILHDVLKELSTREVAEYRSVCMTAAQTVGILSILGFSGEVRSLKKWPKALFFTAALSVPGTLIPKIVTCILFGISILIFFAFCKTGEKVVSDDMPVYNSDSSSVTSDYHRMADIVKQVHKGGGAYGLSADEYALYKNAVRNNEFSGRDMEYMVEGMRTNNIDRRYTRSDEQLMEDYANRY